MTETRSGAANSLEGTQLKVLCTECDRPTSHSVIRSAEFVSDYSDGSFWMKSWDEYQIIECLGCQTVGFRHVHRDTEDTYTVDEETGEDALSETVKLYPNRAEGRVEIDHVISLPFFVQRIYKETLEALRASLPILAAVGMRALVEAMCNDRGAEGRNLEAQLDDLVVQGVVSREGAEILHSLRLMGNQAAHEIKPHSVANLNIAFDVIEHALRGVYVLPTLARGLPKRGGSAQNPAT